MSRHTEWADLDGREASAASAIVYLIDQLLPPEWERINDGPGRWRWTHTDTEDGDEYTRGVVVNGSAAQILAPIDGWPAKVGPTVLAYTGRHDLFATVTLPDMTDNADRDEAVRILAAVVPELGAPR